MSERDAIADIMREPGERPMRPDQEAGIARILSGMGFANDGPEVADLLYRIGARPDAWRYRTLTVAEANSVLEILGRFYESQTRPNT